MIMLYSDRLIHPRNPLPDPGYSLSTLSSSAETFPGTVKPIQWRTGEEVMRPQLSWRKRLLAVGILPIVVAALIVPPAAHASGTSGTSQSAKDGWQRSLAQRPLVVAAEKLQAAIRRDHHAGFAGITLSDNEVVLWWKGDPPAGIVAEATLVRIARAAYSHTELERAAAGIRTGSQSVRVRADGSGLDLVTDQIAVAPPKSDVPVTVVHRERPRLASRHDDWSPWGGGSTIWN